MFHACVQRFDVMDEKFLGGKLNRALRHGTLRAVPSPGPGRAGPLAIYTAVARDGSDTPSNRCGAHRAQAAHRHSQPTRSDSRQERGRMAGGGAERPSLPVSRSRVLLCSRSVPRPPLSLPIAMPAGGAVPWWRLAKCRVEWRPMPCPVPSHCICMARASDSGPPRGHPISRRRNELFACNLEDTAPNRPWFPLVFTVFFPRGTAKKLWFSFGSPCR